MSDPTQSSGQLAIGRVATIAALVLGMLVSSAKSSYDARKNEVAEMSWDILAIDHLLAKYGPETGDIRAEFHQRVEAGVDRTWPTETSFESNLRPRDHAEIVVAKLGKPGRGKSRSGRCQNSG